jgi:hypothetical protein
MKKLYLLIALFLVTAGNILSMNQAGNQSNNQSGTQQVTPIAQTTQSAQTLILQGPKSDVTGDSFRAACVARIQNALQQEHELELLQEQLRQSWPNDNNNNNDQPN